MLYVIMQPHLSVSLDPHAETQHSASLLYHYYFVYYYVLTIYIAKFAILV